MQDVSRLWVRRSAIGALCILVCVLALVLQEAWDAAKLARYPHGWFVVDTQTSLGSRGRSIAQTRRAIGGPLGTEGLCRVRFPSAFVDRRNGDFLSCQELTIDEADAIWDRSYGPMP